jgi:hypothetical protein
VWTEFLICSARATWFSVPVKVTWAGAGIPASKASSISLSPTIFSICKATARPMACDVQYSDIMTLKSAATFAFIGTLLTAALLIWDFVFDVINVVEGLIPLAKLPSSFLFALAGLSLAIFFYVFRRSQN